MYLNVSSHMRCGMVFASGTHGRNIANAVAQAVAMHEMNAASEAKHTPHLVT